MESSFKISYTGLDEKDIKGKYCYFGYSGDAIDQMWDNATGQGVYEIEVEVRSVKAIVLSQSEFLERITNVEEDDAYDAWINYAESGKPFDEWWEKTGKPTYSLDTDDAVAALKAMMEGTS